MNLRSSLFAALAAASVALFAQTSSAQAPAGAASAPLKMAVIDQQRAINYSEDGLRAQATLKKLFENRTQALRARSDELGKKEQALTQQVQKAGGTPSPALQKQIDDFRKEVLEFQQMQQEYSREFDKKQRELTDPIVERVIGVIKRLAAAESFDLIVDRQAVAFVRGDLDLTDRVIQLVNQASGTPAPPKPPATNAPTTTAPAPAPPPAPAPAPAPAKKQP